MVYSRDERHDRWHYDTEPDQEVGGSENACDTSEKKGVSKASIISYFSMKDSDTTHWFTELVVLKTPSEVSADDFLLACSLIISP